MIKQWIQACIQKQTPKRMLLHIYCISEFPWWWTPQINIVTAMLIPITSFKQTEAWPNIAAGQATLHSSKSHNSQLWIKFDISLTGSCNISKWQPKHSKYWHYTEWQPKHPKRWHYKKWWVHTWFKSRGLHSMLPIKKKATFPSLITFTIQIISLPPFLSTHPRTK